MTHSHDHPPGDLGELLDLEAEVLHDYRAMLFAWCHDLTGPRRRIVDLGAGTGTGAQALAEHYPDARVTAVDIDPAMLEHLAGRGLGDRVDTVQADLDQGWPALTDVDLVWTANAMHHLADPDRLLAELHDALAPDGVLVLAELDSFPRFLGATEHADLERRAHEALRELRAHDMPEMGSDWGARLRAAGFTITAERVFDIALPAPLPPAARRYARLSLSRVHGGLQGRLSQDDLDHLGAVVREIEARDDLVVQAERTVWVGRRG